jgi:hypothetical protein
MFFSTEILLAYASLNSLTHATRPAHLILGFIVLIIFGEAPDYVVLSSLLSLPPSGMQMFPLVPYSETPNSTFFAYRDRPSRLA